MTEVQAIIFLVVLIIVSLLWGFLVEGKEDRATRLRRRVPRN